MCVKDLRVPEGDTPLRIGENPPKSRNSIKLLSLR